MVLIPPGSFVRGDEGRAHRVTLTRGFYMGATEVTNGAFRRFQPAHRTLAYQDAPEVDALVQAGTNLSMVSLADEAERWLGKPVIAINAATWWFALRENGIQDKVWGAGRLLREFEYIL